MRIENIYWDQNRIWVPEGKTDNATRFVPMSDRMKNALRIRVGDRKEGWLFPSERSKTGHLTSIAKGFQALRDRTGVSEKVVPYSARHTYGSYAMEATGNIFAVADAMGHADVKSMVPYQHHSLDSLRSAIERRNANNDARHKSVLPEIDRICDRLGISAGEEDAEVVRI